MKKLLISHDVTYDGHYLGQGQAVAVSGHSRYRVKLLNASRNVLELDRDESNGQYLWPAEGRDFSSDELRKAFETGDSPVVEATRMLDPSGVYRISMDANLRYNGVFRDSRLNAHNNPEYRYMHVPAVRAWNFMMNHHAQLARPVKPVLACPCAEGTPWALTKIDPNTGELVTLQPLPFPMVFSSIEDIHPSEEDLNSQDHEILINNGAYAIYKMAAGRPVYVTWDCSEQDVEDLWCLQKDRLSKKDFYNNLDEPGMHRPSCYALEDTCFDQLLYEARRVLDILDPGVFATEEPLAI